MKKVISLFLVCITTYCYSQAPYAQIEYVSKYYYRVVNQSYVPLEYRFEGGNQFIKLPAGSAMIYKRFSHLRDNITFRYNDNDYYAALGKLNSRGLGVEGLDYLRKEGHKTYQRANLQASPRQTTGKTIGDAGLGLLVNFIAKDYLNDKRTNIQSTINYIKDVHSVVNSAPQQTVGDWLVKKRLSRKNMLSAFNMAIIVPAFKSALSDHWAGKGELWSFGVSSSLPLSPEIHWGRHSKAYTRLYGFIEYLRDSHNSLNPNDNLYVSANYVADTEQEFVRIISDDDDRVLVLEQFALGGYFRTLFYPTLFFDIGAGYAIDYYGSLEFREGEDDPIKHLDNNLQLQSGRPDDLLDIGESDRNKFFGLLGIGAFITKPIFGYAPRGAYFALHSRFYYRNVTPNDNYQLFQAESSANGDTFSKIPLIDNPNKLRFTLQFSLGFSLFSQATYN